jgi:hypothetical protein
MVWTSQELFDDTTRADPVKERPEKPRRRDGLHDWYDGKMVWVQFAHSPSQRDFGNTHPTILIARQKSLVFWSPGGSHVEIPA